MKNSTKRALRTFLQSFVGYIAANILVFISGVDIFSKDGIKVLLINLIIPAVATAIAKAMNIEEDNNETEGEEE